jgi:hypothetical protein
MNKLDNSVDGNGKALTPDRTTRGTRPDLPTPTPAPTGIRPDLPTPTPAPKDTQPD